MELQRGTQIAYIPQHANGDINHANVEFGFVTSVHKDQDVAFCRYWSQHKPDELRTWANSEATPLENLVPHVSHPQDEVDELLDEIENKQGRIS
jgi:hypothetical protein